MCKTVTVIALADVLADPSIVLRAVHLPEPRAAVRWVATSELVDPAPYLEGGELLLTTGLETAGWVSEWTAYVARLVEVGVAGLGLGTGLTHAEPPAALLRACEVHGLNLVEVPRATAFVAVSRQTARLLEQEEEQEARTALELQRQLTIAAAGADPAAAVLQRLGQSLSGSACLVAPDGRVVDGVPGGIDLDEVRDRLRDLRSQGLRAALTLSDASGTTVLQPLGLRGRALSYLVTLSPERPSEGQRRAVTTAAALLALLSEQQRDRLESRRQVAARAFELLLSGDRRTAELLLNAGGRPLRLPRQMRVLRGQGTAEGLEDGLAAGEEAAHLTALIDDELCVLSAGARSEELAQRLVDTGLRVGVGDLVALSDLRVSHETAGQAMARASAASPVVQWDRVVRDGVAALIDDRAAAAFSASFLGPLDDTQVEVLRSFLRHHGSRLKVAAELGLHRNTVRNRLLDIEAGLGCSLEDPQVRMSAWLALQARGRSAISGRGAR